jgi:F-type H+-transporting ATPase subunit b
MRRLISSFGLVPMFVSTAAIAAETDKQGMPQLDPSSYASQLFWLAVFFCLFYLFLSLVAVPRLREILTVRNDRIQGDLNFATAASQQATQLKQAWDEKLAAARDAGRVLIATATEAARAEAAAREAALTADINQRLATAESAIATARAAAMGTINEIATGIVTEALPKLAGIKISLDEASHAVSRQTATGKASQQAA